MISVCSITYEKSISGEEKIAGEGESKVTSGRKVLDKSSTKSAYQPLELATFQKANAYEKFNIKDRPVPPPKPTTEKKACVIPAEVPISSDPIYETPK